MACRCMPGQYLRSRHCPVPGETTSQGLAWGGRCLPAPDAAIAAGLLQRIPGSLAASTALHGASSDWGLGSLVTNSSTLPWAKSSDSCWRRAGGLVLTCNANPAPWPGPGT